MHLRPRPILPRVDQNLGRPFEFDANRPLIVEPDRTRPGDRDARSIGMLPAHHDLHVGPGPDVGLNGARDPLETAVGQARRDRSDLRILRQRHVSSLLHLELQVVAQGELAVRRHASDLRLSHHEARDVHPNHLQDNEHIVDYEEADSAVRYDFTVETSKGVFTAIAAKGCLDGNNTNVFERPEGVSEFLIWSIYTNPGADPRRNTWSGIHTRLGTEVIERQQLVDGVVIWDWRCGTMGRPCPKLQADPSRTTPVGQWLLVPPCIYLMPSQVPGPDAPRPTSSRIDDLPLLQALHVAFRGVKDELNEVKVEYQENRGTVARKTTVRRNGAIERTSDLTALRRR